MAKNNPLKFIFGFCGFVFIGTLVVMVVAWVLISQQLKNPEFRSAIESSLESPTEIVPEVDMPIEGPLDLSGSFESSYTTFSADLEGFTEVDLLLSGDALEPVNVYGFLMPDERMLYLVWGQGVWEIPEDIGELVTVSSLGSQVMSLVTPGALLTLTQSPMLLRPTPDLSPEDLIEIHLQNAILDQLE
jgi:hypothetical protein